jgi:hypothetical protein
MPYLLCFLLSQLFPITSYFSVSGNKFGVMVVLVTMILILDDGKVNMVLLEAVCTYCLQKVYICVFVHKL